MILILHFTLCCIGDVTIQTHSGHGNYERLWVNGEELTDDGDVVEMVREAIGQERYIFAMNEAMEGKEGA